MRDAAWQRTARSELPCGREVPVTGRNALAIVTEVELAKAVAIDAGGLNGVASDPAGW